MDTATALSSTSRPAKVEKLRQGRFERFARLGVAPGHEVDPDRQGSPRAREPCGLPVVESNLPDPGRNSGFRNATNALREDRR